MAYACTFTTDPDVELWLTYRSDNTPAGTALQVVPRHYDWNNNIALQIFNNQMRLALSQGGTVTYVSNTSAASASGTWYELHIKCSGSTTTVWRRPAGSNALFEQVLTTSSAPTTGSTMVRLHFGTNTCFSVDNVRLVADGKSTTTRFSYSNANELLYEYIGSITKSYDYDSYGRWVTKTMPGHVAAYAYGYNDKMKTMTSNLPDEATSESFIYDGLDKLRRVTTPAGMTWMRSSQGLNFEALYTEGSDPNTTWDIGTVNAKFINDPRQKAGPPLAMRFPVAGNSDRYAYTLTDNILSVRSLRLDDRTLAGAYEYTPYGAAYTASGPTDYYQFAGLYHDTATDQYWTPYRWYDPETTRWTTPDPLGIVDGPNVYAYVGDGPVRFSDVLGLTFTEFPHVNPHVEEISSPSSCNPISIFIDIKARGGSNDDWSHCMASCSIANSCGLSVARALAWLKEIRDQMGPWHAPIDDSTDDWSANMTGFNASQSCSDCESSCTNSYGAPLGERRPVEIIYE